MTMPVLRSCKVFVPLAGARRVTVLAQTSNRPLKLPNNLQRSAKYRYCRPPLRSLTPPSLRESIGGDQIPIAGDVPPTVPSDAGPWSMSARRQRAGIRIFTCVDEQSRWHFEAEC